MIARRRPREQVNEWTAPHHGVDHAWEEKKRENRGHLLTLGVVRSKASSLSIFQKQATKHGGGGERRQQKNFRHYLRRRLPLINFRKCKNAVPELTW